MTSLETLAEQMKQNRRIAELHRNQDHLAATLGLLIKSIEERMRVGLLPAPLQTDLKVAKAILSDLGYGKPLCERCAEVIGRPNQPARWRVLAPGGEPLLLCDACRTYLMVGNERAMTEAQPLPT